MLDTGYVILDARCVFRVAGCALRDENQNNLNSEISNPKSYCFALCPLSSVICRLTIIEDRETNIEYCEACIKFANLHQ